MARQALPHPVHANDAFKRGWEQRFWSGIIFAVATHFVLFALWPEMSAPVVENVSRDLEVIDVPDKYEVPPPPEEISRPATPVIGTDIDENVTIAEVTFDANPPEDFGPPPVRDRRASSDRAVGFTPYTVPPQVLNTREFEQALERAYPPTLRDGGIGGEVMVFFRIEADGAVSERRIEASSGFAQFDRAALEVAEILRFSPAQNMDQAVAVGVVFPIIFRVRAPLFTQPRAAS